MSRRLRARLRALTHLLSTALSTPVGRRAGRVVAHTVTVLLMLSVPAAAYADSGTPVVLAVNTLPKVIANLQAWILGILLAVATLFAVIGFVYRVTAGGDSGQVDKGNAAFRNALLGYAGAVLAPVLLQVVKGIVGG